MSQEDPPIPDKPKPQGEHYARIEVDYFGTVMQTGTEEMFGRPLRGRQKRLIDDPKKTPKP